MLKKSLAILMTFVLVAASCCMSTSALSTEDTDITDYPVVIVPGYSGTQLVRIEEDGSRTTVWAMDMSKILDRVLARIVDLGKGLVLTSKGDAQYLGDVIGEEAAELLSVIACNPDGTSVDNVVIANPSVEETNTAYIRENELPDIYVYEPIVHDDIAELIGEENCFNFTEDWRMGAVDCATRLDEYIQEVKEYTGKDKVNLLAISHGGQVSATYLSLFGYKCDVDNAVLTVPAIGGAALAYDIMANNIKLDEYTLVNYLEHGFITEMDFEWLVEAQQLGFLDDVLNAVVPHVKGLAKNIGSVWDFMPAEYYDELRDTELDSVANAAIIEKSDYFHHTVIPGFYTSLSRCIDEYGMNVSIIAGAGVPSVTGLQAVSDAIISTKDSTGATTAPFGQRFNDGYAGNHLTCAIASHNHISPSMEVDGTSAYLPENTWYVDKLYHGMTFSDEYSKQLAIVTLLTDRITDVYSDPAYPQFHASTNISNAVDVRFNTSVEGFVSDADTALVITNISKEFPITITALNFAGAELDGKTLGLEALAPGESVEIPLTGELPEVSRQLMQVTVDYYMDGNYVIPTGRRTFDFTIMNGEAVEYDTENPFVDAEYATPLEDMIGESKFDKLSEFGIMGLLETIYNIIAGFLSQLGIMDIINK